ncbi:cilia- and flagella-associated protein 77 isoform X2 [Syngnathus typhle]|uniref:cilia- and flagella-associated protein 77 isoform X2 n=1 Tax=Syngnathus typhle TaxID=161592 RepID=UPI002A6B4748|nr:cilia- and flagella-associated protein 77 isoform X2 [Syngnathus typhle]XP_061134323.1 cilia- and flagella-associated protein 77 isoform X2 [Syngnathus typhle]
MTSPAEGVTRESMRDDSLPRAPPLTGGASSRFPADVAQALSRWSVQCRQQVPPPRTPLTVPDFVTLNQEAIKSGCVTAKQLREYRAQMGVVKHSAASKAHRGRAPQRPQVPDITFGVKTRPRSPLFDLLSHEYGRRWLEDNVKSRNEHARRRHAVKCVPFTHTRTSLLRNNPAPPHMKTRTQTCARYAQVGPALDTFSKRRHAKPTVNKAAG